MSGVRSSRAAIVLAGLHFLFLSTGAFAESRIQGHVKGFWFQQVAGDWLTDRAGARLQLGLSGTSGDFGFLGTVNAEFDSRLFSGEEARRDAGSQLYPVEAWVEHSGKWLELRLGLQYVFWGRTDWENPTDVLTPWDYPDMASELEDYRTAVPAARLRIYPAGELSIDVVWLPVFVPHRLGEIEAEGDLPIVETRASLPERLPRNGEFGLRVSQSISAWAFDWALCAYAGFDKMPHLNFSPVVDEQSQPPRPVGLVLEKNWERMWMAGGDMAKAFGQFVAKAELAFKFTEDRSGDDPHLRNWRLEAVAGLDWTPHDDWLVGVQGIGTFRFSYDRRAEAEALRAEAGRTVFVPGTNDVSVSLKVRGKLGDFWGLQLIAIHSLSYHDWFALGFLWWEPADGVRIAAGAVGFYGPEPDTPYASQQENSRLFAEIKYSF